VFFRANSVEGNSGSAAESCWCQYVVPLANGARAVGLECVSTIVPSANYAISGGIELRDQTVRSKLQADDIGDKVRAPLKASS
jgi:hypothetical protein